MRPLVTVLFVYCRSDVRTARAKQSWHATALLQPFINVSGDELVIVQMRIRSDRRDRSLPFGRGLAAPYLPGTRFPASAPGDAELHAASNAAAELVGSIKEGRVAVGHFDTQSQQFRLMRVTAGSAEAIRQHALSRRTSDPADRRQTAEARLCPNLHEVIRSATMLSSLPV